MSGRIGPPAAHVVVEEIDGDIVLYDPVRRRYYELNPTAGDVWRLATGTYDLDELAGLLAAAYGAPRDRVRADVAAAVAMLRDAGLLPPDE